MLVLFETAHGMSKNISTISVPITQKNNGIRKCCCTIINSSVTNYALTATQIKV